MIVDDFPTRLLQLKGKRMDIEMKFNENGNGKCFRINVRDGNVKNFEVVFMTFKGFRE